MIALFIMAILLPMLLAAAFLLGRHLQRRQFAEDQLSLVTRQHIDLFQGGQLNEAMVEATKEQFRDLLERGEVAELEARLTPGVLYVVQVRALTEIGTDDAGRILERQLQRRLSDDQLEQSWYWIDLANGLRSLNRQESLPHLLRCAESAGDVPLSHILAAETTCFLGFAGYLQELDSPLGNAAMRVMHRAMEGLRFGVPPLMIVEARIGEAIELLWDHRPDRVDPVLVQICHEILRVLRRAGQFRRLLPEGTERESFDWQVSRMTALEPVLSDYLEEARAPMLAELETAEGRRAKDIFTALTELRAEVAPVALRLAEKPDYAHADLAVESLTWSKDPRVGPWLREQVEKYVPQLQRRQWNRSPFVARRWSVPRHVPYRAILRALRGHPSAASERTLLIAAEDRDAVFRFAAVSSLGWWEPILRNQVLNALHAARRDSDAEVRRAARAALARLGERQSLHWFRQALVGEDPQQVHDAVQTVATEGITLLWPDVDYLVDADNPEVAHHASEALERLVEEMEYSREQ